MRFKTALANIFIFSTMPFWVLPWVLFMADSTALEDIFTQGTIWMRLRCLGITLSIPLLCWFLFLIGNDAEDLKNIFTGKETIF